MIVSSLLMINDDDDNANIDDYLRNIIINYHYHHCHYCYCYSLFIIIYLWLYLRASSGERPSPEHTHLSSVDALLNCMTDFMKRAMSRVFHRFPALQGHSVIRRCNLLREHQIQHFMVVIETRCNENKANML